MTSRPTVSAGAARSPVVSEATWDRVADTVSGRSAPTVRRARRRWVIALGVVAGILAVAGFLVGMTFSGLFDWISSERASGWPATVGHFLLAGSLVSWAVGFVWLIRHDGVSAAPNPTSGVPHRERRAIDRMARGMMPAPAHRADLVRTVAAHRLQQSSSSMAVLPGFPLLQAGNALMHVWSPIAVVELVAAVFFAVLLVVTIGWRAQWRAFLQRSDTTREGEPTPGS